jgi:hypothetical protein
VYADGYGGRMANSFKVRFKCPYGDQDGWATLQDREEALDQILATSWDFECPVHGVQRDFPLEAREERLSSPRRRFWPLTSRVTTQQRSSKRVSLRAPVLVYGWTDGEIFVEETTTLLVNAGGALIALTKKVALGGEIFVVNTASKEKQECRVAYIGPELDGRITAGVAFKNPTPAFWRLDGGDRPPFRFFRRNFGKRRCTSVLPPISQVTNHGSETNQNMRPTLPGTGESLLVLAAALIIGAIAPWALTVVSPAWHQILLTQSAEPGIAQNNQLKTANGLAIAPSELMPSSTTLPQAPLTQSVQPGIAQEPGQLSVDNGAPTIQELSKPWSSKTFIYHKAVTKENLSSIAMVIRLPNSEPRQQGSYWAFSLKTPFTHCQLEYITDLRKLLTNYKFQAEHPMVGDPCSLSVFDPLQMADLSGGEWARGAVVKGNAPRPPLGIEIHIKSDRLVVSKMEQEF